MDFTSIAPIKAPKLWTLINAICLIWSIILAIDFTYSETPSPLNELSNKHAYLVWNFGTTIVWLIEVGLNAYEIELTFFDVLYFHDFEDILMFFELLLALYFTTDSLILFVKWQHADFDSNDSIWEAITNCVAYCFAMVKIQMDYPKRKEGYGSLGEFTNTNGNIYDDSSSACAVLPNYSI